MNHKEAFCLMKYRSDDGTEEELLWNSRDGVTPFCISSRTTEKQMSHVEWQQDIFVPYFKPPKGMRVFVDATLELVKPRLEKYIDKIWGIGADEHFGTKEKAFEALLADWLKPGAPWIIEAQ